LILEYPGQAVSNLSLNSSLVKAESDRKLTAAKHSIHIKVEAGAPIYYPVKASGDLKRSNCFKMPYISGSYLPIALIKKG